MFKAWRDALSTSMMILNIKQNALALRHVSVGKNVNKV